MINIKDIEVQAWSFAQIDHEKKTVTLKLDHKFSPKCQGCKKAVRDSRTIAKEFGYRFILEEPNFDVRLDRLRDVMNGQKPINTEWFALAKP
jgi:hypothetical protein